MRRLLVLLVLLTTSLAAQERSNDAEVRSAMASFMAALNALDADGMSRLFADDVTAFVPSAQGDRVNGKAALDAIFRAFVTRTRVTTTRLSLVPEDLQVQMVDRTAVVTFNIREPALRTVRRRTFVWRRDVAGWRIAHMHASDFVSAAP